MTTLLLIILAFILPPLAVAIKDGVRLLFCVNLALYLFAIALAISGNPPFTLFVIAHAIWVICTTE
ncbi:MAG: YqaE/Pmp3 family membrane protein [Phycisphaerales bacterium]|nr:YqaE/Pmp3 family membrane protein [Phycisphaerales bacterium]